MEVKTGIIAIHGDGVSTMNISVQTRDLRFSTGS